MGRPGPSTVTYNTEKGTMTGRFIYWHPGGGHHRPRPYWGAKSGEYGKLRSFQGGD